MRFRSACLVTALVLLTGCGGDSSTSDVVFGESASADGDRDAMVAAIGTEPCDVFDSTQLMDIIGAAPVGEPSEPAGPLVGCSWNTGDVLVSLALVGDEMILAPGEDECPSPGIGEESYQCEGQGVKFRIGEVQGRVSTISGFSITDDILRELAQIMAERLSG